MDKIAFYRKGGINTFKVEDISDKISKEEVYKLAYKRWVATGQPVAVLTTGPYWGWCDLNKLLSSEYRFIDFIFR